VRPLVNEPRPPQEGEPYPEWWAILFFVIWILGWAVIECVLIATMLGANIRWRGGSPPPLWLLMVFTTIWSFGGVMAIRKLIRMWRSRI
jgi:hypothetical protein